MTQQTKNVLQLYGQLLCQAMLLSLTEFTGLLARWRLRFTEPNFEVTHRPAKYREVADTMSILPQKAVRNTQEIVDVYDDSSVYCIVGQISEPNTNSKRYDNGVDLLPATRKLAEAQASDVF